MTKSKKPTKARWEKVYQGGDKYLNASPLPFVQLILQSLTRLDKTGSHGLYIGCGNGRNFLPLVNTGLNLTGLDISQAALDQLRQKSDLVAQSNLVCSDFNDYEASQRFDYVISIQVFQHGTWSEVQQLFEKVTEMLNPGGLFFLRVKSINMPTKDPHRIIERTLFGGFTAHFTEGKKKDLDIHYYATQELEELAASSLASVLNPNEVIELSPDGAILRSHIEAIWQKK